MATANAPWPCPVCAEVLPGTLTDCPQCQLPGDWLDLILALGFSIRQFHYWSVVGALERSQYRVIVDVGRDRQETLTRQAFSDQPLPQTALPSRSACWRCRQAISAAAHLCGHCAAPVASPEVRLLRYQTFLSQEIRDHAAAGRLNSAQTEQFLAETAHTLTDLSTRLERGGTPH